MDNYAIADQLTLLAKMMDIHGENSFKAKAYAGAAFALEKLPTPVAQLPAERRSGIKGIGDSAAKKITELLETGRMDALQQLLAQTPEGVLEMMSIKGLGPKKIHTLWKALHIDSVDALLQACQSNTIASQKGFGEKTQQNILEAIRYQQENSGKYLYAQIEDFAEALIEKLRNQFPQQQIEFTGDYRRQLDVLDTLELATTTKHGDLKKFFGDATYTLVSETAERLEYTSAGLHKLVLHLADDAHFGSTLFTTTGSAPFVNHFLNSDDENGLAQAPTEHGVFKKFDVPFIMPCLREAPAIIDKAKKSALPSLIQLSDIKGVIHAHSNWSDGGHSIEEMAQACIRGGFEYLVLSDHSKAAFYANGLSEERIAAQHRQIDDLNKTLAPFIIFKSIECDILNEGELDYRADVLSTFDLVIASIHSNLQMAQEKAMKRLLGAITNPHVSILGHMTGRLLTKRKGYPVDHEAIIDACVQHNVVIEINAAPVRLDMDWRWIEHALSKGATLSIDPDAHTLADFRWLKYGVLAAQKAVSPKSVI